MAAFSLALVLASQLVANEIVGFTPSLVVAGVIAGMIGAVWWIIPVTMKGRRAAR
ncbi:MAG: hypothetical protein IT306_17655 [Chloroflexi bacterium]|nr:hypothetical protein [Chloroflexota bacterium]